MKLVLDMPIQEFLLEMKNRIHPDKRWSWPLCSRDELARLLQEYEQMRNLMEAYRVAALPKTAHIHTWSSHGTESPPESTL